jgi:hypothetical protein
MSPAPDTTVPAMNTRCSATANCKRSSGDRLIEAGRPPSPGSTAPARLRAMIAPIAATPIAAPMLRANWLSEVAIPSRDRSTPCCTASSSDSIWHPMPAPSIRHEPSSSQ